MAKKRKKKSHGRRRRVSGVGNTSEILMQVAGVAAGAVAANFIGKGIGANLNPKIVAAGQIGAGIFLPKLVKGSLGAGIGNGMIAVGTISLLQNFGVIKGVGASDEITFSSVSGTDELPLIGMDDEMMVSGMDDEESMGEVSLISGMDDDGY